MVEQIVYMLGTGVFMLGCYGLGLWGGFRLIEKYERWRSRRSDPLEQQRPR